ncbi:MAG: PAS domain S-box protein [Deltaproteobacteria bacterium]|nr:PAS domain S-box protein [Deltaproteobacteria bacterium]
MAHKKPIEIVYYRKKGWLNVGRTRMVMFDLLQGFHILQKVIKKEVGENASYLISQAGIKGGLSFLEPMLQSGRIQPGPKGFVDGLSVFTDGGFGYFKVEELDWEAGWAKIICESSVEGWISQRKRSRPRRPVCHYSRGIILGFMQVTHRYAGTGLENELDCVEVSCLAKGDGQCRFIIGTKDTLISKGYELPGPRKSIQEQLRERVWEKTRQIHEANRFNERILRNAPVGIFTLNAKGEITSANLAMSRIFGIGKGKLVGMPISSLADSFSLELMSYLEKGLQGLRFEVADCPLDSLDRSRRFIGAKGIPLKTSRGSCDGLLCIVEDTTEKTLAAQRVSYLKNYNENIIQSITEGIMVLDYELRIQTWNRKMEEIFHTSSKNVLGKRIDQIRHPFANSRRLSLLRSVLNTGDQVEQKGLSFKIPGGTGIVLNLKAIPLLDESSQVSGIILLHEDITDRERIQISYRNLFETAQDGICLTDLRGRILAANNRTLRILETDWQSLEGMSLSHFMPGRMRSLFREKIRQVIDGQELLPYEVELTGTRGKCTPVELSITVVRKGDKVYGLHIIGRDITQRKRLEKQMVEASKLAAIGEIASGVAHEINNPLASVAGYAEDMLDLIQDRRVLGPNELDEMKEALATIIEQSQRCSEITMDLLNFARQGEFEIVPTRLDNLLEKTLLLLEPDIKACGTRIIKDFQPDMPLVETNPAQVQQVFLNILKNALDAVTAKGPRGVLEIVSRCENGFIRISFRDNGRGIPRKHLKNIFNPFFTTKAPGRGTGLGLSICQRIMKKLRGNIEVHTREGKFTNFVVSLPYRWETAEGNSGASHRSE